MKVCLLHTCFADYTIELINGLSDIVELTVLQPSSIQRDYQSLLNPKVSVLPFQAYRVRDPHNFLAMKNLLQQIEAVQPDVLHIQETNNPWFDIALRTITQRFPTVLTIHDVNRHPGDRELAPGAKLTRQLLIHQAQQLIVHSHGQQKSLKEQQPKLAERINVIPHGELGSLYQRALSTQSQMDREPHTLLFFGRIWPYKGLKYLVDAMEHVIQCIPDAHLIIAGRGEDLTQYPQIFSDPQHYTVLNRYIEMQEVTQLFLRSTAVVLPYIEASQSGVAALAYGLGTPIIATEVGGFAEMVNHQKDGLLVPPANTEALAEAIVQLLSSQDLQQRIQQAALDRCHQDLNWSNIAQQTRQLYQKAHRPTA